MCARTKAPNRKVKAPMQSVGAGVTLERVGIDVMGPLPETDKGNRFVLVIGDYWTKWMEAYPIPGPYSVHGSLRSGISVYLSVRNSTADPFGSRQGV